MKKNLSRLLMLCTLVSSQLIFAAGYIAQDTKIIRMSSTTDMGANAFWVVVSGGTVTPNCVGQSIYFRLANVSDAKALDRAFTAAATAFVGDQTVTIYSYVDHTTCNASSIELVK